MAGVPLQRPESFGMRNVLDDAEFAERQAEAARQVAQDLADFDFDNPSVPFGQIGGGQSPLRVPAHDGGFSLPYCVVLVVKLEEAWRRPR